MQASYDLAQARRRSGRHPVRAREERPGAALGRVAEAAGEYRAWREGVRPVIAADAAPVGAASPQPSGEAVSVNPSGRACQGNCLTASRVELDAPGIKLLLEDRPSPPGQDR